MNSVSVVWILNLGNSNLYCTFLEWNLWLDYGRVDMCALQIFVIIIIINTLWSWRNGSSIIEIWQVVYLHPTAAFRKVTSLLNCCAPILFQLWFVFLVSSGGNSPRRWKVWSVSEQSTAMMTILCAPPRGFNSSPPSTFILRYVAVFVNLVSLCVCADEFLKFYIAQNILDTASFKLFWDCI